MKRILPLLAAAGLMLGGIANSHAAVFAVDISPGPGLALNLGSTTYVSDHAIGLSALNAVGMPASPATGGEIGGGMFYDDVTNMLTVSLGYGSDHGFVDLLGAYSTSHIHGPIAVGFPAPNTGAGIAIGAPFAGLHTAGSSALTGSYTGAVILSAANEIDLFDNELYINIHSSFAAGGEIRGQLILVPEPSRALLLMLGGLAIPLRRRR